MYICDHEGKARKRDEVRDTNLETDTDTHRRKHTQSESENERARIERAKTKKEPRQMPRPWAHGKIGPSNSKPQPPEPP